jgi:phthiodiolone/phenolphthiodiolone dimycocerosates ketoreductase
MTISVGAPGSITPPADALLRYAKRNEDQGFDSLWWPDHLMGWHPESIWTPDVSALAAVQPNPHIYLDPVPAIAACATVTERIRLGTSVTEPIRNPPAQLARTWLTLDHITKGRAILGIGAGEGENVGPYGMEWDRPVARLEDALRVIRLLWENDDAVDYEGPVFKLDRAVNGMRPFQEGRYPPIWVAAHGPRMCRITGELGDGWLPVKMTVDDYARCWKLVRDAASKAGRDPSRITAGLWDYTVLASDHDASHRLLDHVMVRAFCLAMPDSFYQALGHVHPLGEGFHGLSQYVPTHYGRTEALEAIAKIPFDVVHESTLHGTPADVAREVARYAAVGLRHVTLWNITFMPDPALVRPSFDLMVQTKDEIKRIAV